MIILAYELANFVAQAGGEPPACYTKTRENGLFYVDIWSNEYPQIHFTPIICLTGNFISYSTSYFGIATPFTGFRWHRQVVHRLPYHIRMLILSEFGNYLVLKTTIPHHILA